MHSGVGAAGASAEVKLHWKSLAVISARFTSTKVPRLILSSCSRCGRFRQKLLEHAARIGAVFVHYDADVGDWIMKVDGL